MSVVTSTLSVKVDTGQAANDLLALQKSLEGAALGVAKLGREIQNHSGNIQRVLGELSKMGFGGLSTSLQAETRRVGTGMRALEREITQAAEQSGKKAGRAMSAGISQGVTAGLTDVEAKVSGATSKMSIAARELSQLSGVNPKRSVTGMPAASTLLADQLREEEAIHKQHGQQLLMQYRQRTAQEKALHAQTGQELLLAYRQRMAQEKALHAQQGQELMLAYKQRTAQEKALHAQQGQELVMQYRQRTAQEKALHAQQGQELMLAYKQRTAQEKALHAQQGQELVMQYRQRTAQEKALHAQQGQELLMQYRQRTAQEKAAHAQQGQELLMQYRQRTAQEKALHAQQGQELLMQYRQRTAQEKALHAQQGQELVMQYRQRTAQEKALHAQQGQELLMQYRQRTAQEKALHAQQGQELLMQYRQRTAQEKALHAQQGQELLMQYRQRTAEEKALHDQRGKELLLTHKQRMAQEKALHEQQGRELLLIYKRQIEEQRALDAARQQYVGRTGQIGGFASALNTAPVRQFREANEAAAALDSQRRAALGLPPALDAATKATKRWGDETKVAHDTARGAAAGIGYLWMTWGNIGAMAAGFAGVRGSISALGEMAEVEVLLTKASREAGVEMGFMRDHMMRMYKDGVMPMMTGPKEVAEQLKNLVYAGFSASEAFDMLGTSLKFAAVGELEAGEAAQVLQQTIHAFNLTAKDSDMIADQLAKAAAASATDVGSMASAMRQAVTVGALYNASVADTATSLAVLAKAGIEGSAAGTALKRFMDELASPKTNKAKEAIEALGIQVFKMEDGVKKLKPLAGIVDEMRDKFQRLSQTDAKAFFDLVDKMQDERGKKFFSLAVKMDQTEWDNFKETIEKDSAGFVDGMYKALSETTKGLFQQTGAQLRATAQEVLQQMDQPIKELARALLQFVQSAGFKEFLSGTISLIGNLTSLMVEHGRVVLSVLVAYKGFQLMRGILASAVAGVTGLRDSYYELRKAMLAASTGQAVSGLSMVARFLPVVGGLLAAGAGLWAIWGSAAESAGRKAYTGLKGTQESAAEVMRRLKELKTYGDGDLGTLRKREEELENSISIRARSSGGSKGAAELLKQDRAELAQVQATIEQLLAERRKANEAIANAGKVTTSGGSDFKGLPEDSTTKKSTSPLSAADWQPEIQLYSQALQQINSIEKQALDRSKAIWAAGLGTEQQYLDERKAIRAKADADAKSALDAYVKAQEDAAASAEREYLKQVSEARKLGLMDDEATLNKIKTAANGIKEAYAKAAQAQEAYQLRAKERADAAGMDALASLNDKYGNPDDAIAKAKEMNAELDAQIDRVKGVSKVTEDRNILTLEGSLRNIDALIAEAEATQVVTGVLNEQIAALKAKRDTLAGQLDEYKTSNVEKFLAEKEMTPVDQYDKEAIEIEKTRQRYEQMRLVVLESTEKTETEKAALVLRINAQMNKDIEALEIARRQRQLGDASQLFGGLAGMAKAFAGEQSKAYRALFAVSKAFSVAQAAMSIATGIARAQELGFPANLAVMAQVVATGASAMATINSSNFSGAYDSGGDIPLGRVGLVGERGPEFVEGPARVTSRVETARMMRENSPPAAPPVVNVKNVNVLDPSLVGDYLGSDEGERLIMNVVQRNQRSLGY